MIPIQKCREVLGDQATGMTDEELTELRQQLYGMVELIFDDWFENSSKCG